MTCMAVPWWEWVLQKLQWGLRVPRGGTSLSHGQQCRSSLERDSSLLLHGIPLPSAALEA